MRTKTDSKLKGYNLSLKLIEKIHEMQEQLGLKYETSVIEHCVNFTYEKKFDNYLTAKKNTSTRTVMTPEEVAAKNVARYTDTQNARQDILYTGGLELLKELGGEEFINSAGQKMAKFFTYSKDTKVTGSKSIITMLVTELDKELLETQYQGCTKDEWAELEKHTNFKITTYV